MADDLLKARKDHHIDIVLDEDVAGVPPSLAFGRYTLEYDGLPEVALDEVDLSCTILGKRLSAPILVGAMTGGTDRTREINHILARAAAEVGLGMALGSQRAMLVHPEVTSSFAVREAAPDLPLLIGNVGAVQLNMGMGAAELRRAVQAVDADALNLHLNPLQEAIQPEGDTDFRGLVDRIAEVVPEVGAPVLIKEVGAGISERLADKLAGLPIAGIEVAGTGGTSWAAVESHRASGHDVRAEVGRMLAGFGVPTPVSLRIVRHRCPDQLIIASGGLRTGMDLAVSLAMGADAVALAKPFLVAATAGGVEATVHAMQTLVQALRTIAFCSGARTLAELKAVQVVDVRAGWPGDPGV